jgi:hypothetical protein
MNIGEANQLCHANGVPPIMYKWDWSAYQDEKMKGKLAPLLNNMGAFIRGRKVMYIYFKDDSVLASRIGVTFLKAAFIHGFIGSRYTNPVNIASYKREHWYEDGDVYTNLTTTPFLVVDKVTKDIEDFQRKIWYEFIDERLSNNLSTIFVGIYPINEFGLFNGRCIDLLKSTSTLILTDDGKIRNAGE